MIIRYLDPWGYLIPGRMYILYEHMEPQGIVDSAAFLR